MPRCCNLSAEGHRPPRLHSCANREGQESPGALHIHAADLPEAAATTAGSMATSPNTTSVTASISLTLTAAQK